MPLSVDGMGELRVMVSEADYDLAKELLPKLPTPEPEKE
jgi:hypothetical protein